MLPIMMTPYPDEDSSAKLRECADEYAKCRAKEAGIVIGPLPKAVSTDVEAAIEKRIRELTAHVEREFDALADLIEAAYGIVKQD